MQNYNDLNQLNLSKNMVDTLTIGRFDGMHLGHQMLFDRLGDRGAILVIENHKANLTPNFSRQDFTNHKCFYYFYEEIYKKTAFEFIEYLKKDFINLKKIVIGKDFKFGHNKEATSNDLHKFFDGEIIILDDFCIDGVGVHSTKIREFLSSGNLDGANKFLGRNYSIKADIIKGQGLGKKEFVPTININNKLYFLPKEGVYATKTFVNGEIFNSATFIGKRSTDENFSVETHILDSFDKTTQSDITIYFYKFIRENLHFDDFSQLKSQIFKDISTVKNFLISIKDKK